MSDERPDALLKSALEKIVYFEARSKQLENDVTAARAEVERLKAQLSSAGQREIELRRHVAGIEVELSRSHRERDELARMNDALKSERTSVLAQLIEASQIHGADGESQDATIDLASFISQLRSEALEVTQGGRREAPAYAVSRAEDASFEFASSVGYPGPAHPAQAWHPAPSSRTAVATITHAPAVSAVSAHAERLRSEGRLSVSREDVQRLSSASSFPGRTEETLFGFSVRELSAPDAPARVRAAERLRALGQTAAAPSLAAALHSEREPSVQVALLSAFSGLAEKEGAAVVLPLLDSPFADVRVSALKALLQLDAPQAGPHLSAAMKDADRAVRRRASLLALGLEGEAARALGEQAVRDVDAEVRALGALVLGAGGGEHARALLLTALRDPEKKVRKAAAQSLSRILGEDLSAVVDLDDPQRRREVRRLATLPVKPVALRPAPVQAELSVTPAASDPVQAERSHAVAESKPQPQLARVTPAAHPPVQAERSHAVAESKPLARDHSGPSTPDLRSYAQGERGGLRGDDSTEPLCATLAGELRISIRGRTVAELASIANEPAPAVVDACELLVARGQAVKRGTKFFAA